MTEPNEQPTRQYIRDKVLKYITDRPGQAVYVSDIMEVYPTFKLSSIQAAVHRVIQDENVPGLNVVVRARAWCYNPNGIKVVEKVQEVPEEVLPVKVARKERQLFEKIGEAKDGSIILECENGDLYRATEL